MRHISKSASKISVTYRPCSSKQNKRVVCIMLIRDAINNDYLGLAILECRII